MATKRKAVKTARTERIPRPKKRRVKRRSGKTTFVEHIQDVISRNEQPRYPIVSLASPEYLKDADFEESNSQKAERLVKEFNSLDVYWKMEVFDQLRKTASVEMNEELKIANEKAARLSDFLKRHGV